MEKSIYKYVLSYTKRDQIYLLLLTLVNLPFIYISLEIPKIIINEAIGGQGAPYSIFGIELSQVAYLLFLCFAFLGVISLNGGLKYVINLYRGVLGERMLMRFRFSLYSRILRFPLPHFKKTSQGEIIPMITAETEPLGGFIGDAFALPAFQGGLLLTYLFFIFQQDLFLGLAAIALYPPQLWLIPKLQRKVNELAKQRVKQVRGLADRVGESIAGINEIHAHDTSRLERADVSKRLGTIYGIRLDLFKRKFFIKFLNNFLAQLTPFFFYSIGGYFVIQGELSLGALVAVLAAYKDISPPWKELLKYYQTKEDIRVKYEQIIEQFQPENMFDEKLQSPSENVQKLKGELIGSNLVYSEDGTIKPIDGANFRIGVNHKVGAVGATGSGKEELSKLVARLIVPTAGRLDLDGDNLANIPETVLGRRQAYVGSGAHIFTGTVFDNLVYGLKHEPLKACVYDDEEAKQREELLLISKATDNSVDDPGANWVDYQSAGAEDENELFPRIMEVLRITGLDADIYQFGLNARSAPDSNSTLAESILKARLQLYQLLGDSGDQDIVERFDTRTYNTSLSVAENILFGAPLHMDYEPENLAGNQRIVSLLREHDLYKPFCIVGRKIAEIMLELFADAPPGDALFEQFSFVSSEALLEFKTQISRAVGDDVESWREDDQQVFLALPFKLITSRHRLGLITEEIQQKILAVRHELQKQLGENNDSIRFLNENSVNSALTVQDNILFGTLVYGRANAKDKLAEVMEGVVEISGLKPTIMAIGLEHHVGSAGARLSIAQKQKLALARCLLKKPDLLIVNEAMSAVDPNAQEELVQNVLKFQDDRGVVWVLERPELAIHFTKTLVLHGGTVVGQGDYEQLQKESENFRKLLPQ